MKHLVTVLVLSTVLGRSAFAQQLEPLVTANLPDLVATYKQIHQHPELSEHEEHTSALLAAQLRQAGFKVTERVGRYPDGRQAYGVVAILENGPGPRLLIRADMDALPVVEETGVPYASHVKVKNAAGIEVGVMHACGHDIHTTTLIGTARVLAATRAQWHGTAMLIGQPSEEVVSGALAMLADHLYERFGRPDLIVALHDSSLQPAGMVSLATGAAMAGVKSVDVTLRGVGAHGAEPQNSKDPITMAGEFIVQLQTIVSRQENPRDPAVVTIGSIHGGAKRNVIPYEVKMELTTRTFSAPAMQIVIEGIRRTAAGVALAAGVPAGLEPIITVLEAESSPATYNDPALAARIKGALVGALGAANVTDSDPVMNSEDFGDFGLPGHQIPTVIFWLGAMDPARFAQARVAGQALPGPHTNRFEPAPEATLRTGITAMTSVATTLLQRP